MRFGSNVIIAPMVVSLSTVKASIYVHGVAATRYIQI